jgi:hypothetical protein
MPNGRNFGRGFGFRGYSPPWPYEGRGRGGLPRCWAYRPYPPDAYPGWPKAADTPSFGPSPNPDQELEFLKNQAGMLKQELELIEARVNDLENKKAPV